MKKAFCVTGMHRSGTSLTASWLEWCGLSISDGKVIEPSVGNTKGHFEDRDFVYLHGSMIRSVKAKSKGWIVLEGDSLRFSGHALDKAKKLVEIRNEKYEIWSWKDPRTVLFLEHWKEIIPELKVLLIWRPFREVFQSLLNRSSKATQNVLKINMYEAAKIWFHYNELVYLYKKTYPKDTLLLPLSYILNENKIVFDLIEELLDIELYYKPLDEIYEKKLVSSKDSPSLLVKITESFLQKKANRMEETLLKLSDTP